jgi:hypothetical protein
MWTYSLVFRIETSKFGNVNTLRAQLIFPSEPNFCNLFDFSEQNSPKNQYLSYLSSEICEINSIKSNSSRAFQQQQECPQIPTQFSVLILFKFYWANGSIINSFHTVAPNNLKPSWCTPTHQEPFEDTKNTA